MIAAIEAITPNFHPIFLSLAIKYPAGNIRRPTRRSNWLFLIMLKTPSMYKSIVPVTKVCG
jgi:hypothetical protein